MENVITKTNEQFGSIRTIEGKPQLWCGKDVATALGYKNTKKALIDHCKGVTEIVTPTNGGNQKMKFIPEADVYRLICHSKLPKAQEFEKWVFEDVVPDAVHECEQLAFDNYEYFDKTFNGQPVLTAKDVAKLTGVHKSSIEWYLRSDEFLHGTDYYRLEGRTLVQFKAQNPKYPKNVPCVNIITKSGFDKLVKIFGAKVDTPKLFIEEKKAPEVKLEKPKTEYCLILENVFLQEEIERCKNYLTALSIALDRCNKHNLTVEEMAVRRTVLMDMAHELDSRICIIAHEKLATTTKYKT